MLALLARTARRGAQQQAAAVQLQQQRFLNIHEYQARWEHEREAPGGIMDASGGRLSWCPAASI
jgi:hypothetical protein